MSSGSRSGSSSRSTSSDSVGQDGGGGGGGGEGDWQTGATRLAERGKHLLETGVWSDCQFTVGLAPNTKVVLSAQCSVFCSMVVFIIHLNPVDIPLPQVDTRNGFSRLRGDVLWRAGGDEERNQNT